MADSTELDVDLHVLGPQRAALDLELGQLPAGVLRGEGDDLGGHGGWWGVLAVAVLLVTGPVGVMGCVGIRRVVSMYVRVPVLGWVGGVAMNGGARLGANCKCMPEVSNTFD